MTSKREGQRGEISPADKADFPKVVVSGSFPIELAERDPVLELVRTPGDHSRLSFLVSENGERRLVPSIEHREKIYMPPDPTAASWPDLVLPDGTYGFGTTSELMSDIADCISEFVDWPSDTLVAVTSTLLATWFPEFFEFAPILWLVGPLGSAKTKALRVLSCFARRSLLVGDIRAGSLYKLTDAYAPTLLIDEFEENARSRNAEVFRFLRAGTTPGTPTVRNGVRFSAYGFKIIASRQPPSDQALLSRTLVIPMLPSLWESKPLGPGVVEQIIQRFQPRLLDFRLAYREEISRFRLPPEVVTALTPRAKQIASVLCAPIQDDAVRAIRLVDLLAQQDEVLRVERSLEPEWLVAEALFRRCHEVLRNGGPVREILVGTISAEIRDFHRAHGEDITLAPRRVGGVLKSLGLHTERLGHLGRGFRVSKPFVRQLHEIARRLGINRATIAFLAGIENGYAGAPCALCEEFDLMAGLKTVKIDGVRIAFMDDSCLVDKITNHSKA